MPIRIKATKEIIDGSLSPNQPIILREPFILAININNTAGIAVIAANIDNFSIEQR
jgi:hypothetical protein